MTAMRTADLAVRALLREAEAGPKPGLVDRFGPGAHTDMDISHFRLSAAALKPFFERMAAETVRQAGSQGLAATLRNLGIEAETAMLAATGGINTHKGAIWTLGLLCAASGHLATAQATAQASAGMCNAESVCDEAARLASLIIALPQHPQPAPDRTTRPPVRQPTNGQAAKGAYGLRSARDEAVAGFPAIRASALPLARSLRGSRAPEDERVITVLLGAMAHADDTCLVARGGIEALGKARWQAAAVLDAGGPGSAEGAAMYAVMVSTFKNENLSPGGSADLCAAALFLADLESTDQESACLAETKGLVSCS